jgi:NAD(P)-dependent dehydrogenase (short-subunit alcohol dehydrogenase family)
LDLGLSSDVAVVFGAAKGIGLAIAEGFAAEKAHVVLVDIDPDIVRVAERLSESAGMWALGLIADCTDHEAVRQTAGEVVDRLGRCDHVVYAAGVGSGKYGFPFWNMGPEDWGRVIDVNLLGVVNVTHAFAATMAEARRGSMLFVASVAGQIGSQTDPPYSAAKAGVINFAQCAAKDLAEYNVRVNTICPGMVQTDLVRSIWAASQEKAGEGERQTFEEWSGEKIRRVAPLGRWQTGEDMANAAVFLASDRAKNITGQTINVDGGQVMRG